VLATDLAAAAMRCPTLFVCGERDRMTPPRALGPVREALANAGASARMIAVPGAGHAVMAEAPDAVSQSLRGFLTDT
jgi:pimeloyl-ACP methyl ester carboxylesterase